MARRRRRTLAQWWRSVKRRKGGVYAKRMRKHANPFRREWGYVGESTDFRRRERDHEGKTAYLREDGTVQASTEKPWMDLDVKTYRIIPLPWWLCWKPVLRTLETLVILLLWPRYNHAKNLWNPRRVTLSTQRAQRQARDRGDLAYRARVRVAVFGRRAVQALGALSILAGIVGAVVYR